MSSFKHQHRLIVVYCHGPEIEETVVRWCQDCGAVVVDIDSDDRTSPGAVMKMRLPEHIKLCDHMRGSCE
jgi:hypothetical protein